MGISHRVTGLLAVASISLVTHAANIDLLDNIIADGELKCGIMLDAPRFCWQLRSTTPDI